MPGQAELSPTRPVKPPETSLIELRNPNLPAPRVNPTKPHAALSTPVGQLPMSCDWWRCC